MVYANRSLIEENKRLTEEVKKVSPSFIPIKSSEPSERSANNATSIVSTIFRFGHSYTFGCHNVQRS